MAQIILPIKTQLKICLIKNFVCKLDYSIIIWDKTIIKKCAFEFIEVVELVLDGIFFVDVNDKIISSNDTNYPYTIDISHSSNEIIISLILLK